MHVQICNEPRAEVYKDFIDFAFEKSKKFFFHIHSGWLDNKNTFDLIRELNEHMIEVIPATSYEHMEYSNGNLYVFECNEFTKSILKNRVNGLFEWLFPKLPEDLSFLDETEFLWLATISHDKMAWFRALSPSEKEYLSHELGLNLKTY
ncbi:hypothetical protein [Alkaliphilus oremlandii]|uniref:Uncharacterized protein n=1 Tax=Alkaliphilus oremlandii (strain OhILAs) TaxID=350688 RepID=A8MKM7_ALKOO|nr:hypothetical protein [Alkaliphilus oremlandii]ABW20359.1 hypothetical protein Clos_2828 [Alkaliphilus oremlandii OhILAs]